jgi:hypothetical protein
MRCPARQPHAAPASSQAAPAPWGGGLAGDGSAGSTVFPCGRPPCRWRCLRGRGEGCRPGPGERRSRRRPASPRRQGRRCTRGRVERRLLQVQVTFWPAVELRRHRSRPVAPPPSRRTRGRERRRQDERHARPRPGRRTGPRGQATSPPARPQHCTSSAPIRTNADRATSPASPSTAALRGRPVGARRRERGVAQPWRRPRASGPAQKPSSTRNVPITHVYGTRSYSRIPFRAASGGRRERADAASPTPEPPPPPPTAAAVPGGMQSAHPVRPPPVAASLL